MVMLTENLKTVFLEEKDPFSDILGQEKIKEQLKSALVSNHHVIIVGNPGIGKTTLAKNVAKLLPEIVVTGCSYNCGPENPLCPECKTKKDLKNNKINGEKRFIRIQGSPDLTVEDILGDIDPIKALKFGPLSLEAFTPGKIFKANRGILFFDELNRCPEKLQNSLLQVLEEGKATIASYDVDLPTNFIFIGTLNPEDTSTERLSDVFLDRFDVIYMGYPEKKKTEKEIVVLKGNKIVEFPENLLDFMVGFVRNLREDNNLEKKPSVRATISLYERAQASAMLKGKDKVSLDDIKENVVSVLSHRMALKPSAKYVMKTENFVEEEFKKYMEGKGVEKESDVP